MSCARLERSGVTSQPAATTGPTPGIAISPSPPLALADDTARIACCKHPLGNVPRHDAAGPDYRPRSGPHARQNDRAAAYPYIRPMWTGFPNSWCRRCCALNGCMGV